MGRSVWHQSAISGQSVWNQYQISGASVAKRGGKPGKNKWVISEWLDIDESDAAITLIAAIGWAIALYLWISR